jgi:hypothetical protein
MSSPWRRKTRPKDPPHSDWVKEKSTADHGVSHEIFGPFFPLEPIQGYVNMDISSELYLDQIRKLQCVQCCFLAIWIASALPQNLQFLQTFRDFTKDSGANFLSMSWNLDALAWGIIQKKTKIMDYLTSNFPLAHVDRANRHRRPQDGTKTGLANYPCVDLPICIHMSHTKSCTSYCPP